MDEQFAGYPAISYDGLNDAVSQVTDRGYNMYIHCNGDAAIDECIKAYKKVRQKHPDDSLEAGTGSMRSAQGKTSCWKCKNTVSPLHFIAAMSIMQATGSAIYFSVQKGLKTVTL